MVKQVKDQLEYTDNFITERTEGGYPKQFLTSGYDLRDFIEDSQSRFTDEIESIVDDLSIKVEQNRKDIRDNEIANKDDHNRYDSESTKQKRETLDNRSELNKIRTRTKKLIQDDRVLGYYLNASEELTVNVNPDTEEVSFLPPPGTFALMDGNFELNDGDVSDTEFIVFNTTDLLDNTRSFLGIFSGDIIELSFIERTEKPNAIDGFDKEYLGRVTFRTKLEYDSASQIGNSIIKVDVAFVNSSFTTDVPQYEELPDTIRLTEYVSVSVMPALVVDDLVDPNTLRNAVLPIGSIIPWASNNIPDGWLICDGRDRDNVKSKLHSPSQRKAVDKLFDNFNFSTLPPISGRYVAGVTGNYTNTGVHSFNTLGSLYRKQTGPPTISLASGGEHSHTATTSNAGSHHHSVGGGHHTSGNGNNVTDVRSNNPGSYETSEAGDHNHNANVASYNVSHNHEVSGFNNDTRPNTVALNYIIKYK